MKTRKDNLFLADIADSCRAIGNYLFNIEEGGFKANRLLQDAVARNIEIVGEAAKNISEEVKNKSPQIEWREIMRMRDKVVHHYFRLDLDIIWLTATQDIPILLKDVEDLIEQV